MFGALAGNTAPFVFTITANLLDTLPIKLPNIFVFYFQQEEP